MNILTLCGSSALESQNKKLLDSIKGLETNHNFISGPLLTILPLYAADDDHSQVPETIVHFRKLVREAEAVIISTPEYLHNIPAVLKNCLEWLKSGGELQHKKVLAITFTPTAPRGEKAMHSLLGSLLALEANIVCSMPLYSNEVPFDTHGQIIGLQNQELLLEAIRLFGGI